MTYLRNRLRKPLSRAEQDIEAMLDNPGRAIELAELTGNRWLKGAALLARDEKHGEKRK